jgi:hypothetical protein
MSCSAADDDSANWAAAPIARFAGPLVDLEVLLHRPVSVGRSVVVDGAAAPLDSLGEDVPDGPMEPPGMILIKGLGFAEWMEARSPQRFIGVDVAHAGDEVLVEQKGLEAASAPCEQLAEMGSGEAVRKRLGTRGENAHGLAVGRQTCCLVAAIQTHPPEFPDVAEPNLAPIGQRQDDVNVPILRRTGRNHEQLAGHLEVNGQNYRSGRRRSLGFAHGSRPQPDQELLSAPSNSLYLASRNRDRKALRLVAAQRLGPIRARADDPRACHQATEVAGNRLDFGQFGHTQRVPWRRLPRPAPSAEADLDEQRIRIAS